MATTYGYGGEFSSDEEIERLEQPTERIVQPKFDNYAAQLRPTKRQIEEAIEGIRQLPIDQEVNLADDLLAALLDHYKTQRGPIVDSTRNLYRKIIMRLIRGEQVQQQASNGEMVKDSNGSNNNNNNNNNTVELINQKLMDTQVVPSSDEDEPMPPASSQSSVEGNRRRFDANRLAQLKNRLEPMEVDSEALAGPMRSTRQDSSSTDEEEEDDDDDDDESSDSEVLDVTPVKPMNAYQKEAQLLVNAKSVSKPAAEASSTSKKVSTLAETAPVAGITSILKPSTGAKEKPFTRSQRVAATRFSSTPKKADISSSKSGAATTESVKPVSKSALSNQT